ncbi:HD domain-containing protein [Patescibacteria group bacterium]|nr:HD domain-containing protein [Patescibacteria group bacterium]
MPKAELVGALGLDKYIRTSGYETFRKESVPELITLDRMHHRKPARAGVIYTFNQDQLPGTRLFPLEAEKKDEFFQNISYLNSEEREKVQVAYNLCLAGHQLKFRFTGEPYTLHPLEMAAKAASEYQADWKTLALCFLHDLAEDSPADGTPVLPFKVEEIYTNLFKGKNNENLSQAKADAQFLARGMRAMKKISSPDIPHNVDVETEIKFRKREHVAEVLTAKKMYETMEHEGIERGDVRVLFVKLLDRWHNLKTIGGMNEEEKERKTKETLAVHVPLAEALRLYRLRDELAEMSLAQLYPKEYRLLSQAELKSIEVVQVLNEFVKSSDSDVFLYFKAPSVYDYYKQVGTQTQNISPYVSVSVVGDMVKMEKMWGDLSKNILDTLDRVSPFKMEGVPPARVELNVSPTTIGEFISQNASLSDIVSVRGRGSEAKSAWQAQAVSHLLKIREGFIRAKEEGMFSIFVQTVSGDKTGAIALRRKGLNVSRRHEVVLSTHGNMVDLLGSGGIKMSKLARVKKVTVEYIDKYGQRERQDIRSNKFNDPIPAGCVVREIEYFPKGSAIYSGSLRWRPTLTEVNRRLNSFWENLYSKDERARKEIQHHGRMRFYNSVLQEESKFGRNNIDYLPSELFHLAYLSSKKFGGFYWPNEDALMKDFAFGRRQVLFRIMMKNYSDIINRKNV